MVEQSEDGPGRPVISLAGTLVVSWPFEDLPPQQFEAGEQVDYPLADLDPANTPRQEDRYE